MSEQEKTCPRCGGTRIAEGHLGVGEHGPGFHPTAIRLSVLPGFRFVPYLHDKESACIDCGLVWNEVPPKDLAELLTKYTTDEARKQLFAEHKPPPRDPFRRDRGKQE